jgi:RND family efflux transporter MFP subunit
MSRIFISLVALSFIAGLGACSKEPEEAEIIRPVRAVKVGDAAVFTGRSFPGRARAHQEVDLSFRVAGPLVELPTDIVGRGYRKGDVIARIDPRDYEVKVQDAEGKLERAKADARRAQAEYMRELNIFKEDAGATSKAAVDRKRAARDQANADIKSLAASLDAAKDELSYTYLKAPFDGKVTAKFVDNFQDVRQKQPVVRLLDTSSIQMVVDLPETLISRLPYVTDIQVVFDTFPDQKIPARIYEVGTEASRTTRTFPVTLIMDQPDDIEILAGMAGRAFGRSKSPEDIAAEGIPVPVGAVFKPETEQQDYVWVVDENTGVVTKRKVTTGKLTSSGISISDGIKVGEWVVTAGVHSLEEGQQVRILNSNGE